MRKFNLFLIITAAFLAACSGTEEQSNAGDEVIVKTINVEVKTVKPSVFESHLRIVGNVETSNDIMISAEVGGRVVGHFVEEGEDVQKGETILKIEDSKLTSEKARLQAITEQAKTNFERLQRLYEEEGIGSEIEYLNARANYQQNKAALESINVDLANTQINAPFSATVEKLFLEEGEMAAPGMEIVRLIGNNNFIVSAGVPARYAGVVQTGDEIKVWFDTQNADTLTGKITYVGASINPQNRTFRIEVQLPPKAQTYKVDMIANLQLNTLSEENVIVVSEEFVYKDEEDYIAYVLAEDEDGNPVAQQRVLTLGPAFRSEVIVRDGLEFGDELITIGSAFLSDGMRLNVMDSASNDLAVQ